MAISVEKMAEDAFFRQPSMIKFLLAENLALKNILHQKGLMTPEEFKQHQQAAEQILTSKMKSQLDKFKKDNEIIFKNLEKEIEKEIKE